MESLLPVAVQNFLYNTNTSLGNSTKVFCLLSYQFLESLLLAWLFFPLFWCSSLCKWRNGELINSLGNVTPSGFKVFCNSRKSCEIIAKEISDIYKVHMNKCIHLINTSIFCLPIPYHSQTLHVHKKKSCQRWVIQHIKSNYVLVGKNPSILDISGIWHSFLNAPLHLLPE